MEDADKKNTMPDGSESTGLEDMGNDEISGKATDEAHAEAARKLAEEQDTPTDPDQVPEAEKSPEEIEGDRRAQAAQVRVNQPKRKFDETIPGGRIMSRSGRLHNAKGQLIDEGGRPLGDAPPVIASPEGGVRRLG